MFPSSEENEQLWDCDALDAQKLKSPKQRNDYFNIFKK